MEKVNKDSHIEEVRVLKFFLKIHFIQFKKGALVYSMTFMFRNKNITYALEHIVQMDRLYNYLGNCKLGCD